MSVITSVFSKTFLATMSALVMVAGMLFGANIATADSAGVAPTDSGAVAVTRAVESASLLLTPRSTADGALGSFTALGTGMYSNDGYKGVNALAVAADGTVYAGGFFDDTSGVAGTKTIAAWTPPVGTGAGTWSALGSEINGRFKEVTALAVAADGTVYAGGYFDDVLGVAGTNKIASWTPPVGEGVGTWSALGAGLNNGINDFVEALAVAADGTVYAGGYFDGLSGVADAKSIAAWSGSTWSALSTGIDSDWVQALAVAADGTVYAGGQFISVSGVANTGKIAAWSGSTWSALGTGEMDGTYTPVYALTVAADGTMYAGGYFGGVSGVAGTRHVAAWSGSTWSALGTGINDKAYALAVDDTRGLVYAGGNFTATVGGAANSLNRVGVWDTGISEWIPFTYGGNTGDNGVGNLVMALAVKDSVVYLGGLFTDGGGVADADRIAQWTWEPPQGSNSLSALAGATVTVTGKGFVGVPATGGVKVGSTVATYTRVDSATITMTVPTGSFASAPITVNGVGGWGEVGVLNSASPPQPVPAPPAPAPAPEPSALAPVPVPTPLPNSDPFPLNPVRPDPVDVVRGLSPTQMQQLSSTELAQLPPQAFAVMTPAQARALRPKHVTAQIGRDMVSALSPEAVRALQPRTLNAFKPWQIRALTPEQARALRPEQIAILGKVKRQIIASKRN